MASKVYIGGAVGPKKSRGKKVAGQRSKDHHSLGEMACIKKKKQTESGSTARLTEIFKGSTERNRQSTS